MVDVRIEASVLKQVKLKVYIYHQKFCRKIVTGKTRSTFRVPVTRTSEVFVVISGRQSLTAVKSERRSETYLVN